MADERRYRRRFLNKPRPVGYFHNWPTSEEKSANVLYSPLETNEECWDHLHTRSPDGKYREGDEYSSRSILISRIPTNRIAMHRPGIPGKPSLMYTGGLTCQVRGGGIIGWSDAAELNMAKLYSMAKPDKRGFSALNFVYELKDVPEMLHQKFTKNGLHLIEDLYLAYQFGWKPLLADIRDMVSKQLDMKKMLDQYIRDEGRPVHRKARILLDSSTDGPYVGKSYQTFDQEFVTQCYANGGPDYHQIAWFTDELRFSGEFVYTLPPGPRDWKWKAWMLAKIFGGIPTPSVVYRAIPWSWLVDWFGDVGDMVDNATTQVVDRLSTNYAYVTQERKRITKLTGTMHYYKTDSYEGPTGSAEGVTAVVARTTNRIEADPFGKLGDTSRLTYSQASILGALGLSRTKSGGSGNRYYRSF